MEVERSCTRSHRSSSSSSSRTNSNTSTKHPRPKNSCCWATGMAQERARQTVETFEAFQTSNNNNEMTTERSMKCRMEKCCRSKWKYPQVLPVDDSTEKKSNRRARIKKNQEESNKFAFVLSFGSFLSSIVSFRLCFVFPWIFIRVLPLFLRLLWIFRF